MRVLERCLARAIFRWQSARAKQDSAIGQPQCGAVHRSLQAGDGRLPRRCSSSLPPSLPSDMVSSMGIRTTFFVVALLGAAGCEGYISPAPETSVMTGPSGPEAANPAARCTEQKPLMLPRRLVRLSNPEIVASLAAVSPLDEASLPAAWRKPSTPLAPDPGLSVSRDFLEQVSGLGLVIASTLPMATNCQPSTFGVDPVCTRASIGALTHTAFRAQETTEDIDALVALALDVGRRSGAQAAARITSRALAMSPRMLYLMEGVSGPVDPTVPRGLSVAELASFISFRVTQGPPTEAFLAALKAQPTPNASQLKTMLEQHLGVGVVARTSQEFLSSWVSVPQIGRATKNQIKHPEATPEFMASLQQEAWSALGVLALDGRTGLAELLTVQGKSVASKDDQAPAGIGRPGVFALPGVIAGTSAGFETNLPRRGRFLLRRLFCESLSSPPAGAVAAAPKVDPTGTERQRFANVEAIASCSGCHARIDHLASAFEVYDEVGRMRVNDEHGNRILVDDVHKVKNGEKLTFTDATDLMRQTAKLPLVQGCFSSQAFTHFARQPQTNPFEACEGERLAVQVRQPDGGFPVQTLVLTSLLNAALAPRAD